MADRFYGYQYGTSARKLNTEYNPYKRRYPQNEEPVETTNNSRANNSKRNSVGASNRNSRTNSVDGPNNAQARRKTEYQRNQVTGRKLNSDVQADRKRLAGRSIDVQNENNVEDKIQSAKISKAVVKAKLRIVLFLFAGFAVLFAISYQNSLISESFNRKEQYKKEMEALSKTNQQIEVSLENNLNLNSIEQAAKEQLGMQKLNNDQKIYVSLPKEDYVAPAAEQVVIEEEQNFFVKLWNGFTKALK